jgi:hypothetical protein
MWPPLPAKDYRAELVLTPNAVGGTDLRWTGSFTVRFLARRLVTAAERN